jgi:plasmid stability protein
MKPLKQAVYSSRTADKFVVRLPDGMREKIAEVARQHHRSMNSEIIARLERSMLDETSADEALPPSHIEELAAKLDIQPWAPQVGQVVRRRDSREILGVIKGFELSSNGLMANCEIKEDGDIRKSCQAVGLLELVDIFEVIELSSGTVHRALERIAAK